MGRTWSKLQSKLYEIIDPKIDFQIHMAIYKMNANNSHYNNKRILPRYWITIGKDIIFDYPKEFDTTLIYGDNSYPWDGEISEISNIIEEYINCPIDKIIQPFENDKWDITNIIRVCDRRIGKRRLLQIKDSTNNEKILKIIEKRLNQKT